MRTRVLSSILVVIAGLLPTLIGGPVFATFMIALCLAAFREFLALSALVAPPAAGHAGAIGAGLIVAYGAIALIDVGSAALFAVTALAIALPIIALLPYADSAGAIVNWALTSAGILYLGLPVYAAVALRSLPGSTASPWLTSLAEPVSLGWPPAPLGLAWVLTVMLAIWTADSAAYLIGRTLGRRRLAARLSPNKTVEGAVAGFLAAIVTGALAAAGFGLTDWRLGLMLGALLGLVGQLGDLAESLLKRQARVKDSGAMLPGHGGVLDRIDALLFALPTAYVIASAFAWLRK